MKCDIFSKFVFLFILRNMKRLHMNVNSHELSDYTRTQTFKKKKRLKRKEKKLQKKEKPTHQDTDVLLKKKTNSMRPLDDSASPSPLALTFFLARIWRF